MKRAIILVLCLCLATVTVSCGNEYDILSYQENDIIARCYVNEKYDLEIKKTGECVRICIFSPDFLCGITFEFSDTSSFAIKDDVVIPIDKKDLNGIYALSQMFSLSECTLTTVTENGVISFKTDLGVYTVSYGENNLPKSITILGDGFDYTVEITGIEIKSNGN